MVGRQSLATLRSANKRVYQIRYLLNRWLLPTTRPFRCPSMNATRFRFQQREARKENDARSFTQCRSDAFQPALWSKNPLWQAMPLARCPGKKALPDAWRSSRIRRSAWQQECKEAWALYA